MISSLRPNSASYLPTGLCREVFVKRACLENAEALVQDAPPQVRAFAKANRDRTEIGLRDLQWHKDACDHDLRNANFNAIEWAPIRLSTTPDFVCSGLCYPDYDFAGKQLQDLSDLNARMQLVTFSVIPTNEGGIVVFAWHSTSGQIGWQLAASLSAIDNTLLPHAVVRFAFSYSENKCLSPSWWESLDPARSALQHRAFIAASMTHPADGSWLVDDGLRVVEWKVGRNR